MDGDHSGNEAEIELHARRASSFGATAAEYAEHRPDYPAAGIRWALEPVGEPAGLRVLDLAAGTGKLTAGLLALGVDVVAAVEPDDEMRAELTRQLPGVRALPGTAEEIPLPDGAVDAVLVGQAMHWFDLDRAFPEIARVLRPGGVLAGLWNADDRSVAWVDGLVQVSRNEIKSAGPEQRAELLGRIRGFLASRPETARGEFDHPLTTLVIRSRRVD